MSLEHNDDENYDDIDIQEHVKEEEEEPVTQSGGKMIGDGIYGCVFMPELRCVPHTKKKIALSTSSKEERHISKLIDNDSASIEFNLSKSISAIPLWRNYFVVSESLCQPAVKQVDPDLSRCEAIDGRKMKEFKILSMPYRGDSLHLHRFSMDSFDFMRFAKHMIEAGALMNLFNIVHRDLHQGNVLVDSQDVPRIIDFNLSFQANQNVTASALSHRFEPNIAHEPPDSALVNAIYQHHEYRANYEEALDRIIDKKSILRRIRSLLGTSTMEMRRDLDDFYRVSKSAKAGDTAGWFRMYWTKIDSWAIGTILVDLIVGFMNMRTFSSSYSAIRGKLEPILRDMCQINPIKRMDCVRALYRLDPNHFIIRKYAQEWLKH
jgi:serine/threonine protein kinase